MAAVEVETRLLAEADDTQRVIHFRLGRPRPVRTVRLGQRSAARRRSGEPRIAGALDAQRASLSLALPSVITTIVLIRAEPASLPKTAQRLAEIDGVTDVYSVSGDWDLVAIVKVAEYDQIAHVVTEVFPTVPGLQRTQTLTAFRAYSKKDLQQAWDIGVD